MRRLLGVLLVIGCTTTQPPPQSPPASVQSVPYGFTVEEESRVLALEDRREYDPAFVDAWIHHANPLHRARIALALGRIGPHTFIDANGNGERDPNERQAGVDDLGALVGDRDANVRVTVAFALGQIGDPAAGDTLVQLSRDGESANVTAEAVEALSKLAPKFPLGQYASLTAESQREGVRARAIRYLFRFRSDEASAIAANALGSPSPAIRQEAAYALARRAYAPARARLELLISDPNVLTRAYAIRALSAIAAPESLPILVGALGDSQPWVRTNAVVAIAHIGAKTPLDRPDDALRVVALTDDPDPGTRAASIEALGYYAARNDASRKKLLEIATAGSRWQRELAAGAIAKQLGDEKLLPKDLTGWAKVRVLEAASPVSDRLRPTYARDPEPLVRASAMSTIADDHVDANIDLIRNALSDPDVIVRGYAIDRYSKTQDAKKLETLTAALERAKGDRQDDARLAAIRALAEISDSGREPMLRGLLSDADAVVRRVAADLIEQKLKKPRPQFTPLPIQRSAPDYVQVVEWAHQPHTATIHMTRGRIEIALLAQDAPMTAWNFAQLARSHFFDRTSFMRVVPNFVIQGGDPRNDMEGGPGYAIRDEINLQKYTRGAVGMALSGPDTGGSQFFVTHSPQPHLDGGYTIFGRVYEGMSGVVDPTERGDAVETITIDEHPPLTKPVS